MLSTCLGGPPCSAYESESAPDGSASHHEHPAMARAASPAPPPAPSAAAASLMQSQQAADRRRQEGDAGGGAHQRGGGHAIPHLWAMPEEAAWGASRLDQLPSARRSSSGGAASGSGAEGELKRIPLSHLTTGHARLVSAVHASQQSVAM